VIVRTARDDERDAIRALTVASYAEYAGVMTPDGWSGLEQAMTKALASNEPVERIVAEDEGAIIGSVLLYPASSSAYGETVAAVSAPEVRLLSVAPAGRGRGVARALMEECVQRARRAGATELGIHTSRSMLVAKRMYERMGFVRAPDRDFRPPGAELVEGYRLPLV
jgi:GNAT superfamily N-acetyltransferase